MLCAVSLKLLVILGLQCQYYNVSFRNSCFKTSQLTLATALCVYKWLLKRPQTFGHMEFILKLERFAHLRDNPDMPESICACHDQTLNLIMDYIKQVKILFNYFS